ncbi:MAG: M14 family metallopeptidase, partial [Thermoplasmata archaeon]
MGLLEGAEVLYHYRNYTGIRSVLFGIESLHSNIAKVYDVGNSWEKNHMLEDRDILAIKVSDNVLDDEDEPEVLIVGLHHAREWTTSELVTELVSNLTHGYGNDSRISWLVDNREIWLVPVVNPDGLDYSLSTGERWRKNRRLNYDGSYGVDLNRNYEGSMNGDPAGEWGGVGSSHDPSDETYCGEAPFSEPETLAIRDLVLKHDFQIALDFHSYSELVLWPWGYTTNLTADNDDLVRIGTEMAALNGYDPMQSVELYPTTGDSIDWHYGGFNIFAFCFEIGTEFHPSSADTVRSIISANLPAALLGIEIAGDKHEREFEIVHDAITSRNYSASGFGIFANITAERGVNASCLRVIYRVNGDAWLEVPMARAGANDTYQGLIPPLSVGSIVEYYIAAQDSSGVELLSPRYAPYDLHTFVVTPAVRDDPPVVDHTPRGEIASDDTMFVSEGIAIRARVVDDHGVRGASLNYREGGTSDPFLAIDMAHVTGDTYVAVIPSSHDAGAEYYIEARDDRDQVSRAPAGAPDVWYLSYNMPPVLGPVTVPGSPPGNVSCGQDIEVAMDISDDFGVHDVTLIQLDQYMAEYDHRTMSLKSGTLRAGLWSATFRAGPVPGVIFLEFVGFDGRASAELAGTVIHARDTTPPLLQHEYSPMLPEDFPSLSVRVSDDIGIVQVQSFLALDGSQGFQALAMARVSGTETEGLYECVLPLGDFAGEVKYYFEAYDGTLVSALPADAPAGFYVSTVTDPTPLEVLFNPPRSVEGSLGFVLSAEARNATVDTTLILHMRDAGTGDSRELTMTSVGA